MAREVKIVVKNVYAPAEQQQFIVDEAALVQHLKQLVHEQFPGRPLPTHQKLIFGGKICADSEPLQAILNVNQVQSEECAEDATAVVFHLLVTSVPPRSRPNTPPAAAAASTVTAVPPASTVPTASPATSAAAATQPAQPTPAPSHVSVHAVGADHAAVDSPRPSPAAPVAAPSALHMHHASARAAPPVAPPATPAPFSFPAPGQFTTPSHSASAPSLPSHEQLLAQGMLMHQQALILMQIQYLQCLQRHAQAHASAATPQSVPASQQPLHGYAQQQQYAHYGHYFGMGMHAPVPHAAPAAAVPGVAFQPVPPPPPAAAAAPRPDALVVQIAREILPLFDLRLALKMAFMLFIIGQDTPNDRVLMLALLSFLSYLHITGILAKIYEVYKRHYAPVAPTAAPADANGNNHPNVQAAAADPNARAANGGAAAGLARLDLARVLRISSDRGGFVQDVKYFVVGFLLSLVPAWHPQPLNGGDGAAAAPPVQDMPDVAEMPVQGI